MVQTAGFDPSLVPVGPSEGRRPSEREPDSNRITPVDEGEELRADRRRAEAGQEPIVEPPTRVAFTAKFGPDKDGFPLQIVSGEDLVGAETINIETIAARRISREDREVLLRAQEEFSAAEEAAQRRREAESVEADRAETVNREAETRERDDTDTEARSGSQLDLRV